MTCEKIFAPKNKVTCLNCSHCHHGKLTTLGILTRNMRGFFGRDMQLGKYCQYTGMAGTTLERVGILVRNLRMGFLATTPLPERDLRPSGEHLRAPSQTPQYNITDGI